MDSLTAHYLARELDARWRGRALSAFEVHREGRRILLGGAGSEPVCFDLAAREGRVGVAPGARDAGLLAGYEILGVRAPTDDRRIAIDFEKRGKFRGSPARLATLEVSFVPSARGAALRREDGPPLAAVGAELPPPAIPRPLLDAEVLQRAARVDDRATLLGGRWMSPGMAAWLIAKPERAEILARWLTELGEPNPSRCGAGLLPFPYCEAPKPAASLVEPPMEDGSRGGASRPAPERADRTERALRRLREELARASDAPRLREAADALVALGSAPAPERITAGGIEIATGALPGETAMSAAARLFAAAQSRERAGRTLPARIAALERSAPTAAPAESGAVASPAAAPGERPPRSRGAASGAGAARAPAFRTYRSAGGLDIWVGRGAASNDRLTFRESSPDDVWLHARDAAGAHVILRWQHEDAPPARDLEQAAQLAAWHSKARGSAVVPVDWTRRKYVRKPRRGAPGLVVLQQARTVMARPRAEVERALRVDRS